MRTRKNYLCLALFVVYFIVAIIQANHNDLLPAWLYISIGFVTIDITLCEAIQNLIVQIIMLHEIQIQESHCFLNNIMRHIDIFGKFPQLKEKQIKYIHIFKKINASTNVEKLKRRTRILERTLTISKFAEILICALIVLLAPLKTFPYNVQTNKLISVLTLFSFSFTFFALTFNSFVNSNKMPRDVKNCVENSKYYLEILEELADENIDTPQKINKGDKN